MKRITLVAMLMCLAAPFPGRALAQEDNAMMESWMAAFTQYADPDEHHERLASSVGRWEITTSFRFTPESPWMESTSEAMIEAVLGGRFFLQRVTGPAMIEGGPAFEGLGLAGYDRINEKYVSMWADNHGTMLMTGTGSADATGSVITSELTYTDPVTKQPRPSRWVMHYKSQDQMLLEMHEQDESGAFFLSGKLLYRRIEAHQH